MQYQTKQVLRNKKITFIWQYNEYQYFKHQELTLTFFISIELQAAQAL